MGAASGTTETRKFYDEAGWTETDGESVDRQMFGTRQDGPIRIELHRWQVEGIHAALRQAGDRLRILECGCGGNPEPELLPLAAHYTGVDFSETGIALARRRLARCAVPHSLQVADVCHLPFEDGRFDAVYSAHMIYHIDDAAAQQAALDELCRVTRPGGVVVLIAANPYPLLFPVRMARRLVADAPGLGTLANKLRPPPPLPYKPMSMGWYQRRLERWGEVTVKTSSMPSVHFNQHVPETGIAGQRMWRGLRWLTLNTPGPAARLGNFVQFTVQRAASGPV